MDTKKNMKLYTLTCEICGKTFQNYNSQAKSCGEECRKELNRQSKQRLQAKRKEKPSKKPNALLVEMNIRAKELGLSYGQYSALKYEGLVD
jgi:hypothetical protein